MTDPDGAPLPVPTVAEARAKARAANGAIWAWICKEIINGRLPPGTTPDTLPDHMRPAEPES